MSALVHKKELESWEYKNIYVKKHLRETEGCSENYKLRSALSPIFIHLGVYHPEALDSILDFLKLKEESQ